MYINRGTMVIGYFIESGRIDNPQVNFVFEGPEARIKVQEFVNFNNANLTAVRKLTLIDMASNIELTSLSRQAPNLEQLILKNCLGLAASPANLQACHQLKSRGIDITLEGMQDFQNSYSSRYPAEASMTLPQAMTALENSGANQSNTMNLTSLRGDNHNSEQLPAAGSTE